MEGTQAGLSARRHARHASLLILGLALCLAATGCRKAAALPAAADSGLTGHPEPVWELPDASGHKISSRQFAGRPHLVVFWASWCGPCHAESRELIELRRQFAADSFEVIGLSVEEDASRLPQAAREWGLNYPVVSGGMALFDSLHFDGIPRSYIVDSKGIVREEFDGLADKGILAAAVARALH